MKFYARVENNQIVEGPMTLPENYPVGGGYYVRDMDEDGLKKLGWLPVEDNSMNVDNKKFAVSPNCRFEIKSDKVEKIHLVQEYPKAFFEEIQKFQAKMKVTI